MKASVTMVFTGSFVPDHFCAFVHHRAQKLDLDVRLDEVGRRRVGVTVGGEADLIDAFEMACSLGPLDCLVIEVIRDGGSAQPRGAADER